MTQFIYKRFAILMLGFALLTVCASCGETGGENSNSANSNKVNVITPEQAVNGNPDSGNSNSKMVPYPGLENGKNPTLDESKVKVIDMSNVKPQPVKPKVMPDGSEIMTVQSSDGLSFIETRKFINDQTLAKIERITKSANDRVVKVHLRNGKVITLSNEKIKDFAADTASSILIAAGVKPEAPPVAAPGPKDQLKKVKPGN